MQYSNTVSIDPRRKKDNYWSHRSLVCQRAAAVAVMCLHIDNTGVSLHGAAIIELAR
jgi:hypothetical protein